MALTKNTPRAFELGDVNAFPVLTNVKIYEGSAVGIAASTGVYARPLNATDRFVGFAEKEADNTGGASAAINVRVKALGLVQIDVVGADNTKVGSPVYASDDGTFTLTSTGNSKIGFVHRFVTGTTCIVYFDAHLANYA